MSKDIYYVGDFVTSTGPANVNKNYIKYIKNDCYYIKDNSKIKRILHFVFFLPKCKIILISGLSNLHSKICKLAKKMNKTVVYLMHGYVKEEYKINQVPVEKRKLLKTEKSILENVDKIICVSEKFSDFLKRDLPNLKEKITYVNNGIEIPRKIESKRKNNNSYKIVSIGGGVKRKNNLDICKAIEKLKDIDIKYTVIGAMGEDGEKIKKYSFVNYYEKLPHEEVLRTLAESNLYIQNSYFETFGLGIFEAISSGCEILVSNNVGALSILKQLSKKNVIINNEDYVEIANKIKFIYENRNEKVNYLSDWKLYTWEKSSKKLIEKCMEATNDKRR